ncbi:MAG: hypothetical protein ACT4NU_00770 [Chromatiales bacterium]
MSSGHISCSAQSRSEIVVRGFDGRGEVAFVLDGGSDKPADFDETDKSYLERVVRLLERVVIGSDDRVDRRSQKNTDYKEFSNYSSAK